MKKLHKDHVIGILFAICNTLLYVCIHALIITLHYSLTYYYLSQILQYLIYPMVSIGAYFILRRKLSARFTYSVILTTIALFVSTFVTLYVYTPNNKIRTLLFYLIVWNLPIVIDLIMQKRARKSNRTLPIGEVAPANPDGIVFAGTTHPILRGIIYAVAFMLVNWIIFLVLISTPLYNTVILLFIFVFGWLCSIPFYYLMKQECTKAYFFSALISMIAMTILCYLGYELLSGTVILPHNRGWDVLVYLIPLIGLPIYGFIPITIDGIISIGKSIYRSMAVWESRH